MGNQHPLATAFKTESAIAGLLNLDRERLIRCQAPEEFYVLKALHWGLWLPRGESVFHLFQQEGTRDDRLAGEVPRKARVVTGYGLLFLIAHGDPFRPYGLVRAVTPVTPG